VSHNDKPGCDATEDNLRTFTEEFTVESLANGHQVTYDPSEYSCGRIQIDIEDRATHELYVGLVVDYGSDCEPPPCLDDCEPPPCLDDCEPPPCFDDCEPPPCFDDCEPPPPPPVGQQGCTPGYWKQPHHFDSWMGYTPDSLTPWGEDGNQTMLEALSTGGGDLIALWRHAAAAMLNLANSGVTYSLSQDQIWEALQSGDKDQLEGANQRGCPLN
jgi:hypothetical protein